jgi:protein TonB
MYYAAKKQAGPTRVVGIVVTAVVVGIMGIALLNVAAPKVMSMLTETEVVIIEDVAPPEEEPPPPPPVDVELPPPPPQVILPDFVFDTPPPPNAIQQVQQVARPAPPPAARPAPPPKPAPTVVSRPAAGRRFEKPEYPPASQRAKEEGEVTVSVCVDAQGRMSNIQLVKSSGFPRLDDATVKGLPKTRLEPAKNSEGKAVEFCNPPHQLTIVWELED